MELEEKIRRRLAPFVMEGQILAPRIQPLAAGMEVTVRLRNARTAAMQSALARAMSDLGPSTHLVIAAA